MLHVWRTVHRSRRLLCVPAYLPGSARRFVRPRFLSKEALRHQRRPPDNFCCPMKVLRSRLIRSLRLQRCAEKRAPLARLEQRSGFRRWLAQGLAGPGCLRASSGADCPRKFLLYWRIARIQGEYLWRTRSGSPAGQMARCIHCASGGKAAERLTVVRAICGGLSSALSALLGLLSVPCSWAAAPPALAAEDNGPSQAWSSMRRPVLPVLPRNPRPLSMRAASAGISSAEAPSRTARPSGARHARTARHAHARAVDDGP